MKEHAFFMCNFYRDMSVWYAPNDTATGQLMEFMQEQFLQEVPVGYGNRTFQGERANNSNSSWI